MKVYFVQPLMPHYRLGFFTALARQPDLALEVHCSPAIPGLALDAVAVDPAAFTCVLHPCTALAGGRLLWQHGLALPPAFGRGDVAVIPGNPRFLSAFKLLAEARARGVATVWAGQGFTAGGRPWAATVRRHLGRLADLVLLYTDAEVATYHALGFPADRLGAFNNGLDPAPIRAAEAAWPADRVARFRAEEGLEGRRLLLFIGRLTAKAELPVLLEALPHLPSDVLLVVAGDGEQRAALANGVPSDRVRWLGAAYSEDVLAPWCRAAELFVYPGGVGLSLLHAFNYGLPGVTHADRAGQMPEFAALAPGVNGETFRRGDARDLARVLRELLADPARLARMSAAARETVRETYTLDDMVARYVEALRRAVVLRRG